MTQIVIKYRDLKLFKDYFFRFFIYPNNKKRILNVLQVWRDRAVYKTELDKEINYGNYIPFQNDIDVGEYIQYTKSFCKMCGNNLCFRHGTVLDIPFGISLRERFFAVTDREILFYKEGWIVRIDREKAIVERPSGLTFKYNNHGERSTYQFLLTSVLRSLELIIHDIFTIDKSVYLTNKLIDELLVKQPASAIKMQIDFETARLFTKYLEDYAHFEWNYRRDKVIYYNQKGMKIIIDPEFFYNPVQFYDLYYYPPTQK